MQTREQRVERWARVACREDQAGSELVADLYDAFQAADRAQGYRDWPDGYSVSPKLFAQVMRRVFPGARYRRSNGSRLDGISSSPPSDTV